MPRRTKDTERADLLMQASLHCEQAEFRAIELTTLAHHAHALLSNGFTRQSATALCHMVMAAAARHPSRGMPLPEPISPHADKVARQARLAELQAKAKELSHG